MHELVENKGYKTIKNVGYTILNLCRYTGFSAIPIKEIKIHDRNHKAGRENHNL